VTPQQFRIHLATIRWPQWVLAAHLGVQQLKVWRWSAGLTPIPPEVETWVRALATDMKAVYERNPPPEVPRLSNGRRAARENRQQSASRG
jgi:hypothetical protein